jgi:hypothetical protein
MKKFVLISQEELDRLKKETKQDSIESSTKEIANNDNTESTDQQEQSVADGRRDQADIKKVEKREENTVSTIIERWIHT